MNDDLFARSVAALCGALSVLAEQAESTRKPSANPMTLERGIAHSDAWLEQIRPGHVKISSTGERSYGEPEA